MKKISLKFKDILRLLEYIEFTKKHHYSIDEERATITCELSEADIELAVNGYGASLIDDEDAD